MALAARSIAGIGVGALFLGIVAGFAFAWWVRSLPEYQVFERRRDLAEHLQWERRQLCSTLDTITQDNKTLHGHLAIRQAAFHSSVCSFVRLFLNGTCPESSEADAAVVELAGPNENWEWFYNPDQERRHSALVHFICRVLYRRMIPDGDLGITLLPVDILSSYRHMLDKVPQAPDSAWSEPFADHVGHMGRLMTQYWRTLTTFYTTETFRHGNLLNLQRTNCMGIGWDATRVQFEEVLKQALSPFFKVTGTNHFMTDVDKGLDCETARERMRNFVIEAADLALTAFSNPEPTEFYWPLSLRRTGCDPESNDGMLQCFGMRQRSPPLGLEVGGEWPLSVSIVSRPGYNDTFALERGTKTEDFVDKTWKSTLERFDGEVSQEMKDEYKAERKRAREYESNLEKEDALPVIGGSTWW